MNPFKSIRLLASVLLTVTALSAAAAQQARLIITTKSGTVAEFLLADRPVITYQDNMLRVTGGGSEISVEATAVASFDFVPSEGAGIEDIDTGESRFNGLRPGSEVQVYDLDGRIVTSFTVDDSMSVKVNLASLGPGYYIVRTAATSFKIKKQ